MSVSKNVIGFWDYVVIIAVLLTSSGIGMYYRLTGGRQKTIKEYLLADKNMHMVPVSFSLVVSFISAITILGLSGETYTFGIEFLGLYLAFGLFTPIAAYLYLPVFFRLQAISSYEYLEKRFGKTCRLAASISFIIQTLLYISVVLYAPALALEALTGFSKFLSIFTIGFVCVFYGSLGGMKAALMSDLFQLLLMFGAIISVIVSGLNEGGGFGGILETAAKGGRLKLPRFDPDPTIRHSWFSLIIGGGVNYLSIYIVTQTQIQRFLTLGHIRRAQKAIFLMWAVQLSLMVCLGFAGLVIYSKYHQCDPISTKVISSQDQLMPYYVVNSMGHIPGLSGLFVAGIFSASLSSITGALNSLAAVIMEDYLKTMYLRWTGESLSDAKMTISTKVLVLVLGSTCIGLAFLAQFLGGLLQASITIFGGMCGPLLGIFSLGMFVPVANEKGTLTGLIVGTVTSLWIGFGGPRPHPRPLPLSTYGCNSSLFSYFNQSSTSFEIPLQNDSQYFWLYRLSYLYTGVIGVVTTILVGYIVSLVYDDSNESKMKQIDLRLFVTPVAKHLEKKYKLSSNTSQEEQSNLMNIQRNNIMLTNHNQTNFENNN